MISTDANVQVTVRDGGAVLSFVAEGELASTAISLLVVVDDRGQILWLIAAAMDSPESPAGVRAAAETSVRRTTVGASPRELERVVYGSVPAGFEQLAPEAGTPAALSAGMYKVFFAGRASGFANFSVP